MLIKKLGTSGEIKIRNICMITMPHLVDKSSLCDIGEEKYLKHDRKFILISHLLPDHACFFL